MDVHSVLAQARSQTSGDFRQQQSQQALQQTAMGRGGGQIPSCPLPAGIQPPCQGQMFPSFGAAGGAPTPALGTASEAQALVLARWNEMQQRQLLIATGTQPARGLSGPHGSGGHGTGFGAAQNEKILKSESVEAGTSWSASAAMPKVPSKPQNLKSQAETRAISGPSQTELDSVTGKVASQSQTQAGSKNLQRQLLRGHPVVVGIILAEMEQEITTLMCDAYGNFLCSAAFQACTVPWRKRYLERLEPHIDRIAKDKRGTHALQTLIGTLTTLEEQDILMRAINRHVIELSMDNSGTHVVKKILLCFMPPFVEHVFVAVLGRLVDVVNSQHGLCVVKDLISKYKSPGRHQDLIVCKMSDHVLDMVQDPYGNYAIQHAMEVWGVPTCIRILQRLEGQVVQLSIQKFSSNVIEKVLLKAQPDMRWRFINELIQTDRMATLVQGQFGHFVAMRAVESADDFGQVQALLETINRSLGQTQCRRTKSKWEKVITAGAARLNDSNAKRASTKTFQNGDIASQRHPEFSASDIKTFQQAFGFNNTWPDSRGLGFPGIAPAGFGPISQQPAWGNR